MFLTSPLIEQAISYAIRTVELKEEAEAGIEIVRQNGTSWSLISVSSYPLPETSRWLFPLPLEPRNSILSA
jgi:hypothetical protein